MNVAGALQIICVLGQVPGCSRRDIASRFRMLRESGVFLETLSAMSDDELGASFGWNLTQMRVFKKAMESSSDRFRRLASNGIGVNTLLDDELPPWRLALQATPWLFYRGDISLLERPTIGFSGSRDASDDALGVARSIANEAARSGMNVISGGARGVDMAAHSEALAAGGVTTVMLPQGIDTWWPIGGLADPDVSDRILIISEDPPWDPWSTAGAMQRNRAIVDLANIITIPQAGTTGGSHNTGMYALGKGLNLWVADLGKSSPGNQLLLQRGAHPLPWRDGVPDLDCMQHPTSSVPKPRQQSVF